MSVKILSVDDSRLVRIQVKKALAEYDIEVLEAENGEVGLEVIRREKPELVLLDITMPVMTGDVMLVELRKDPVFGKTPVVMLSADLSRETMLKMARNGSNDYIPKPFTHDIIRAKVERFLPQAMKKADAKEAEVRQAEADAEGASSNKRIYFIPEDDHLIIRFPNFNIDTIREINNECTQALEEAVNNNILDIFIDLAKIPQLDISLAASVYQIDMQCKRKGARCHVIATETLHSKIRSYPGCEHFDLYLPPKADE